MIGEYKIVNLDYDEDTKRQTSEDSESDYRIVNNVTLELVHVTLKFKLNIKSDEAMLQGL